MSNVDTVKRMYDAFGKGNVGEIIEQMDENVMWDTKSNVPGVPWLAPRRGKSNIGGFFESLAPMHITRFAPPLFSLRGIRSSC